MPCPKQGQLQVVAHDRIQSGFEYLQEWRLHNLYGLCQGLITLALNKFFPYVLVKFNVFQLVSSASSAIAGHHYSTPSSLYAFTQ